jgi:hypothetical protein
MAALQILLTIKSKGNAIKPCMADNLLPYILSCITKID